MPPHPAEGVGAEGGLQGLPRSGGRPQSRRPELYRMRPVSRRPGYHRIYGEIQTNDVSEASLFTVELPIT